MRSLENKNTVLNDFCDNKTQTKIIQVPIFGRETPVELDLLQVSKL